jgi:hypothetical protein
MTMPTNVTFGGAGGGGEEGGPAIGAGGGAGRRRLGENRGRSRVIIALDADHAAARDVVGICATRSPAT